MSKTETVAIPAGKTELEPVISVGLAVPAAKPNPELEIRRMIQDAIARTESGLVKWAGGNTQFEATRFKLGGQLDALQAIQAAMAGDPSSLQDL